MDYLERSMNPAFGMSNEEWNGGWGNPNYVAPQAMAGEHNSAPAENVTTARPESKPTPGGFTINPELAAALITTVAVPLALWGVKKGLEAFHKWNYAPPSRSDGR
ncbi:MAG: hypothetical protein M3O74_13580 [Pseudomonadota bacterium]|nr:hypothetical protein [Pseudomonadota bacterium]